MDGAYDAMSGMNLTCEDWDIRRKGTRLDDADCSGLDRIYETDEVICSVKMDAHW